MEIDYKLLKGEVVALEPALEEHRGVFRQLAHNDTIWEFTKTLITGPGYDAMFDAYYNTAMSAPAQHSFLIRELASGEVIGMTRFYEISMTDKRLSIGHTWYIPRVWGQAHNKECKLMLLRYVFEHLSFNRVAFYVAHQNVRSQKAMEKIGGTKEGVLRKYGYRGDGSLRDSVLYSIISDEWPEKKRALENLLQNFR
jgi:N-acetyltransferase